MSDDVTFQTSVTATPPNATRIATDNISGAHHQLVKVEFGDNGTAYALAHGTPMPIGTLPGGTLQIHGTAQLLGTFQPLAGSVHLASGTVQVLGTVQIHGTAQALGTFQQHGTAQIIGTVQTHGTSQVLGSVQGVGTFQALGTVQPLAGSVHLANAIPAGNNNIGDVDVLGTVQTHGTSQVIGTVQSHGTVDIGTVRFIVGTVHVGTVQRLQGGTIDSFGGTLGGGTVQVHGTAQVLGTLQPLAGSVHLATNLAGGTVVAVGSAVHGAVADTRPHLMGGFGSSGTQAAVDDGDAVRAWFDLNGRLQIRGTIDSMPAVNVATGTIPGGTVQLHGTSEILGTVRALTTVNVTVGTIAEGTINSFTGTAQVLGTIQGHGTFQVLGTIQTVAAMAFGSVQGWQANGGAAAGNPVLLGGFGSSGTQAAVSDGDVVRAWFDLNGRQHVTGTTQGLPGSVHLATNLAGGTVVAVGSAIHGAAADARPLLMAAFGSSGTQAAVDDGDSVRLWADLNGRLQIFGTVGSITAITIGAALPAGNNNIGDVDVASMPAITGTVQSHGTVDIGTVRFIVGTVNIGTIQAGSVHVANTAAVLGTTSFVTGGTAHIGSVQRITGGTIDFIGGTVAVGTVGRLLGTVLMRPYQAGEGFFSTVFTGAGATNGTLVPAPASGTYTRVWDVVVSGSAAGSAFLELGDGTQFGRVFTAVNGGWSFNSAKGVRTNGTSHDILFNYSAGSWGVSVNYSLEIL